MSNLYLIQIRLLEVECGRSDKLIKVTVMVSVWNFWYERDCRL